MPRAMPRAVPNGLLFQRKYCDVTFLQPEVNVTRTHWGKRDAAEPVLAGGRKETSPSDFRLGLKPQ